MDKFDRKFWRRLWALTKPYWVSEERRKALTLLIVLLVIGGGTIALGVWATYIVRGLMTALSTKHAKTFYHDLFMFLAYVVAVVPVFAYYPYLQGKLGIAWREWVTRQFLEKSFAGRAFYRINRDSKVDNPDQRIADDINSFTFQTTGFVLDGMNSLVSAASYFVVLWLISRELALVMLAYVAVGTWVTVAIGRRLIKINFNQERYQADFRFGLVHVRDNAEQIAMYGGEEHETHQLMRRFASVVKNYNLLIFWQRNLAFFTNAYSNVPMVLPYLLLAGAYFAGKIQFGEMSQASIAFGTLQGSLSIVVNEFQQIADYTAVVNRLALFWEECHQPEEPESAELPVVEIATAPEVATEGLTLMTPDYGRTLIRELSLEVPPERSLLISGRSGAGKTSLMRAIAGLWTSGSGRILRPELDDVMFLPQRPYMSLGSLREQLCYPAMDASEDELRRVLKVVNLDGLPERFGGLEAEMDWQNVLSLGEQQRLAFARLLLRSPRYAFLDEATSSLDEGNEELLYRHLQQSPITYASVGHRSTLRKYHEQVLELDGETGWRMIPNRDYLAAATG